jgi:FKBP-type peptidyl-prolyl cis-trans isomerase
MSRSAIAIAIAVIMVGIGSKLAPAQSAPTKKSAKSATTHPNTKAPTKVTGDGVKTESGLQYWDVVVGTGAVAKEGDRVRVHYTGWLSTGKKFDSSLDWGRPLTFALGNSEVIQGWDEGIAGMKVGGKRQLRIPPELGYGEGGTPDGTIPPNATLIFDVQLLSVQEPPAQ